MPRLRVLLKAILVLFSMVAFSNLAVAEKGALAKVTKITTDNQIPKQVQTLWRDGFEECTEKGIDTSESLNGLKIHFPKDPKDNALYIIACGGPGYNRPYVAIAFDAAKNRMQRMAFPSVSGNEISTEFVIYNPVWNNQDMTLSTYGKDRGLGDCGQKATYKWMSPKLDSGFALVKQYNKSDCDGQTDNFPQTWPPQK